MKLSLKENIQNSSKKETTADNQIFGVSNYETKPQSSAKKTFSSGTDTPAFRGNRTLDNENIRQPEESTTKAFTTQISGLSLKIESEEQKVIDELKDIDLKISSRL